MPHRSSKDINQVDVTSDLTPAQTSVQTSGRDKNPAAVALGRMGGLKGGRARAESLSKSRRKAIARLAALKRWRKKL